MKVETYLKSQGAAFQTHEHPPAYTAQEVAAEEHVSGKVLAKTGLIQADGKYALCVLQAHRKLDMAKVARALGARMARLADEQELSERFPDVEVGAEPPFGNLYSLPTLVDEHLAGAREIIFQAGTHRQVIRMKYADYAALSKPMSCDLVAQE